MNGESVRLTRSSRSLDTRPLRAFIITSICSFIACISTTTSGGVISVRDGRLTYCHSGLLGALLPFSPSWSRCSALVPSWSSSRIPCPAFWRSYSSKTQFCLVRHSTATIRVCTCLSRAVGRGSSSWTLLVVAIDRVSTMQLFVWEAFVMTYNSTTKRSHRRRQLMMPKKWAIRFQHACHQTCPIQKKTLQRVPVWYWPKTLRRLSQKKAPTMLESMSFREIVRTLVC